MKTLRDLRKFILVKSTEGNQAEIRPYVLEHIAQAAIAFHVSAETILSAMDGVSDDASLASRMLETIHAAETRLRKGKREGRASSAQASAMVLSSTVDWQGDKAFIDVPSLLASVLTRRQDMLTFVSDDFSVSVYMGPLMDLSRIARARTDLTGYVDAQGLHLRWGRGGLNLKTRLDRDAEKIFMSLPARSASLAA